MNHAGDPPQSNPGSDRERQLRDDFAGVGRDDCCAHDLVGARAHVDFGHACGLAVQHRAIHRAHLLRERPYRDAARGGLGFAEPDVSDFRVGINAPGNCEAACAVASEKQRVADHDSGVRVAQMRELQGRAYVAGGKDVRIAGLQIVIDPHAGFAVVLHARGLEADFLHVGRAPSGHQDFIDLDFATRAAMLQAHDTARRAPPDACDLASSEQLDAVAYDRALDDPGRVAVLARQDLRQRFQQPHFRTEAPERLRQFASDRPGANHREPPRQLGQ